MNWYLNGKRHFTLHQSDVEDENAWNGLVDNNKFLLLNVAIGGGHPDGVAEIKTPTNTTLDGKGASLEVDYVVVYLRRY